MFIRQLDFSLLRAFVSLWLSYLARSRSPSPLLRRAPGVLPKLVPVGRRGAIAIVGGLSRFGPCHDLFPIRLRAIRRELVGKVTCRVAQSLSTFRRHGHPHAGHQPLGRLALINRTRFAAATGVP